MRPPSEITGDASRQHGFESRWGYLLRLRSEGQRSREVGRRPMPPQCVRQGTRAPHRGPPVVPGDQGSSDDPDPEPARAIPGGSAVGDRGAPVVPVVPGRCPCDSAHLIDRARGLQVVRDAIGCRQEASPPGFAVQCGECGRSTGWQGSRAVARKLWAAGVTA